MQILFIGDYPSVNNLPQLEEGWHKVAPEDTFCAVVADSQNPLQSLLAAEGGELLTDSPDPSLGDSWAGLIVGKRCYLDLRGNSLTDSPALAHALSWTITQGFTSLVVFLGIEEKADAGKSTLEALGVNFESGTEKLASDLSEVKHRFADLEITVVTASRLPFLGIDGLGPHLSENLGEAEASETMRQAVRWASKIEAAAPATPTDLFSAGTAPQPYRRQGSACGGGVAGALVTLGARLFPSEDYLSVALPIRDKLDHTDLVICQQETLDYLSLPTSIPATVAELAQPYALPVLALAKEAPVTKYDLVNVGIHGLLEIGTVDSALGERLARTWSHR